MDPKILSSIRLFIPGPEEVSRRTDITAILVRVDDDDYVAYIGAGRDVDFVRKFGNKMSYAEAAPFFPYLALDEAHYRK